MRPPHPGEVLVEQPEAAQTLAPEPEPLTVRSEAAPERPSLVVQTSFLGDVILTTPLIADLATRGPVDVVTTPAAAPLLANNPSIRDVIVYDKRGDAGGLVDLWRVSERLKAKFKLGFSSMRPPRDEEPAAYLAQGSIRSATLALLAGFRVRVGFATSAARALYTRRVSYRDDRHHVERLWALGTATGVEQPAPDSLRPRLFPGARDVAAVDALLVREGYGGEPLVAIAPGSSWPTKRWPHYAALAAAITSSDEVGPRGARIVLIGGPHESDVARAVLATAPPSHRPIDATGQLSPLASADLIRRCRVLITNDSAPQHIASAVGTPTVTIFGPTVPEFGFGPLAPRHATAGLTGLPCRPCHRHGPPRCPLGHWRCMRELAVRDVTQLVQQVTSPTPAF